MIRKTRAPFPLLITVITLALSPKLAAARPPVSMAVPQSTETCQPIRLDEGSGPLAGYPFLNQGDIANCYAFAYAKLMDSWARKRGLLPEGFVSSPLDIAMQYSALRSGDSMWGGSVCSLHAPGPGISSDSRSIYQDPGVCRQEEVVRAFNPGDFHAGYLERLEGYYLTYQKYEGASAPWTAWRQGQAERKVCRQLKREMTDLSLIPSTLEILTALEEEDRYRFLSRLLNDRICSPEQRLKLSEVPSCRLEREMKAPAVVHQRLQSLLNQGLPVSVGYCSRIHSISPLRPNSRPFIGVDWNRETPEGRLSPFVRPRNPTECENHAAVVVGRRWRAGRCEFLIFNSQASSADTEGRQWVSAEDLTRNIFSIEYLD